MKTVNYLAKPTKAVAVVINLTDGVVLSGNMFVPTQWRMTDLLNDERGFLPMQTTDGAMIAVAKSNIKQVTLPQAETKVYNGRDPYRILGVEQGTSAEDIKTAYHNLCKMNHPDLIRSMGLSPEFQELGSKNLARINAAYAEIMSALNTLAEVRRDRPKSQALTAGSLGEDRFHSLVDQEPAAILVVDEQMKLTYVNGHFLEAQGFDPQEVLGRPLTEFVRLGDQPEIIRTFAALRSGEMSSARITAGILRKDGSHVEMLGHGRMATLDGKPAIVAVLIDISEHLQAEEDLRDEESRFLCLVEENDVIAYVADADGNLAYINRGFEIVSGYTREEVIGRPFSAFVVAEQPAVATVLLETEQNPPGEVRLKRKHGEPAVVLMHRSLAGSDERPASIGIGVEITGRTKTEENLREEQGKFRALVEQNVAGTYVIGEDGKIVYANPAFEELCGYPPNEVIGRPLLDFIADEKKEAVASALAARRDGKAGSTDIRLKRKNGQLVDVLEQGTSIRYAGSGAIIGTAIDVSDLKRAGEAEREEKNTLHAAMEAAPDAILLYDCDLDRNIGANKAAERLFACPGDEIVKHGPLHFCSADQPDARPASESFAGYVEKVLSGNDVRYEARIFNAAGQDRLCEVALARLPAGARKLLRASFVDVTEQRSAERALRTLIRGTQAVVRATEENELLRSICRILAEVGEYEIAWYGVPHRDEAKSIWPVAWAGNVQDVLETTPFSWSDSPDNADPYGLAVSTGQPQVVQDFESDPKLTSLQEMAARYGMRSCAVLPVKVEWESLFGILVMYSRRSDSFDAASLGTLEELANDLAYAISTMRLRGERQKSMDRLLTGMERTIQSLASTAELRDPYTAGHQRRVADLATAIARELNLPDDTTRGLYLAAMMHDVGRIQVPLEILNRPGKLSNAEAELVKMHAEAGYDLLKDSDFSWPVAEIVRQHHERIDGSGYPRGLKGQEILLEARILAVADVVDSMNSNRPYRAALGLDAALDEIEDGKGTRYDAAAADACTRLIRSGRFTFEQAGAQSVAPLVRGSAARRFGLAPTPLQRIANGFRG